MKTTDTQRPIGQIAVELSLYNPDSPTETVAEFVTRLFNSTEVDIKDYTLEEYKKYFNEWWEKPAMELIAIL